MKIQQNEIEALAASMIRIGTMGAEIETLADAWFNPLRVMEIQTLEEADVMFSAVYECNHWSQVTGRPAAGSTLKPAPDAVKFYVSTFRKAYRLKLDVVSFSTMYKLRAAIAEKVAAERTVAQAPADRPPQLRGIQLVDGEHLIEGAIFHNAPALWQRLPEDMGAVFLKRIQDIYDEFVKLAPPDMLPAAAA